MDHAEVREILDLAAAEPGGVDRLEAGDTPEAAAVAGHLVTCETCAAEWRNLTALSAALRDTFAEERLGERQLAAEGALSASGSHAFEPVAPLELKERTLRYVRELGRPAPDRAAESAPAPIPLDAARRRQRFALGRLAAIAAAVVLAVGLGALAYVRNQQLQDAQAANSGLYQMAEFQAQLAATGDAQSVPLLSADGAVQGSVTFSPSRNQMVMVAHGIPAPGKGQVLRCWVETGGGGTRVLGDAQFDTGHAYWWGWPSEGLSDVKPGDKFGVSLVDATAPAGSGTVLLTGTVGG